MSKKKIFIEEQPETPQVPEALATPPTPKFLSKEAIHFREPYQGKRHARVPASTPKSIYDFETVFPTLPENFSDLDDLEIPIVRESGIQKCIELLAEYFDCKEYKNNLLQFWFLDIITDCIWKTQDEFRFPPEAQKTILGWILYVIELIRSDKNFSRKKLFGVFKEAILVAAELVDEGHLDIPLPNDLISLINEDEEEEEEENEKVVNEMEEETKSSKETASRSSSNSSISVLTDEAVSYVELDINKQPHIFELPKETCNCEAYNLRSLTTLSESKPASLEEASNMFEMETLEDEGGMDYLEDIEFYKPDYKIPARFLPLEEEERAETETEEAVSEPTKCLGDREELEEEEYDIEEVSGGFDIVSDSELLTESISTTLSTIFTSKVSITETVEDKSEKAHKPTVKEIIKNLREQKLLEHRIEEMSDPRKGWLPYDDSHKSLQPNKEPDKMDDNDEWFDIVTNSKQETELLHQVAFYNFGVLWAVIDFIFNYFYDSFQFTLIKLAFQATPNIIVQSVNDEWRVPKFIKGELKKPPKKKEPKPKKEKKPKDKGKKDKSSKKSKDSAKKDKKKPPKEKKPKKEKPKKPTKEELAEMARLKREQERLEEELRIKEENRRFMFPLNDAANDELFKGLFENWVKIDPNAKGKKGKKGKK